MRYIFTLAITLLGTSAYCQTRFYYGPGGELEGQSQQIGPNSKFYFDNNGGFKGQSIRNGNNTTYFGEDGSYLGNSVELGRRRNYDE